MPTSSPCPLHTVPPYWRSHRGLPTGFAPALQYNTGSSPIPIAHLRVCLGHGQALDPLLRIGTVLGLQDKRAVVGEDLEGLGNVAAPLLRHFHRADGAHVERLRHPRLAGLQEERVFSKLEIRIPQLSTQQKISKSARHSQFPGR